MFCLICFRENVIRMKFKEVLGIDFGGSGIKGAPVDTKKGLLLEERYRIPTPSPSTPEAVSKVVKEIVKKFKWKGPVGVGFPSVVLNGVVQTASNIDKSWIGVDAEAQFSKIAGLPVNVVNDADAAGMAELSFGEGVGKKGTIILLTVGTGIGSVVFANKKLVANSELGQIILSNGVIAEKFAADSIRQKEELDWKEWGQRFNFYLSELEKLFYPELIIIGGGVSKKKDKFIDALSINTKVVMAKQKNEAGIIGAALAAKANKKKLLQTLEQGL